MSMKDALDNFNSTMVRLKAAYRIIMQSLEGNFNSTMVRLKENTGIAMKLTLTIFQFHYGTIKRKLICCVLPNESDFNSTMVRLKVLRFVRQKLFSVFQFHYGTIKRFWFVQCLLVVLLFQFHYGTIKSI